MKGCIQIGNSPKDTERAQNLEFYRILELVNNVFAVIGKLKKTQFPFARTQNN
jgi:hypothetical protein